MAKRAAKNAASGDRSGDSPSDDGALPFEAALERLEELVEVLEGDDLDLERSLSSFEEGVKLVRVCSERIRAAELRVSELERGSDGAERELELDDAGNGGSA
jgi:exodeoxyribonuclease VII small subunit